MRKAEKMSNISDALERARLAKIKSEYMVSRSEQAADSLAKFRAQVLVFRRRNYDALKSFIDDFLEKYPWGNLDDLQKVFSNNYPSRPTNF